MRASGDKSKKGQSKLDSGASLKELHEVPCIVMNVVSMLGTGP